MLIRRPSATTLALMAATAIPLHALVGAAAATASAAAGSTTTATSTTTSATTTAASPTTTTTQATTTTTPQATTTSPTTTAQTTTSQTTTAAPTPTTTTSTPATPTTTTTTTTTTASTSSWARVVGDASGRVAHSASDPGVSIVDYSFSPGTITIKAGDTITWVNNGKQPHTATASNGSFNTGTLKTGQSASHTFTTAGTFAYICSIHPFMHGTVVVEAASTAPSQGGGSSSTSGSSGSTATTTSTTAAAVPSGPSLPSTGLNLAVTMLAAAALLAFGAVLRRRSGTKVSQ